MARVLVAYATKHHSTAEIAEAVAGELRARGHEADAVEASAATAEGYDAVVLGSATYAGRWRREARRFLSHERDRLARMPFWVFSSGPVGEPKDDAPAEDDTWLEPRKVIEQAEAAGVREHVVFGGRLPEEPDGFIEKAMVRNTPEQFQDRRDWDEIRGWADRIADQLAG
ncbi:flavodoxin domain-containing protein [Agromyces aurantiacus]|uniref:Flavodoxin domain-containing protein n=1 Tax=Agromyces aurantiacus TaxID=165814 RepID=A0ABV9RBR9_9MICO|nr:flavodoxin domain-containing protein [Agromyces aurantiacus]MBM7505427.1 menaquinone-dependent protoporphyrinogen oxidase [Agromyces aurantiacus]